MLRFPANSFLKIYPTVRTVRFASGPSSCSSKVAVVLSGCGVYDGSEIHETVAVLTCLTRNNAIPQCFAPNIQQKDVINHLAGKEDECDKRNVLTESARISRGNIKDLCELVKTHSSYDAVIFPGGFGVAKNLSDFASKGSDCTVIPEVVDILQEFHKCKKPIGLACIAPILAARVLCKVQITLGKDSCDKWPYRDAIQKAKDMGAIIDEREVHEVSFDSKNMIFSTPAFMYDGHYHQAYDSVCNMVKYILAVLTKGK